MEEGNQSVNIIVHEPKSVVLEEPVGFSAIPNQVRELGMENGFSMNILIVGRRGLGTKTLINSLYNASILSEDRDNDISTTVSEITENSIKLKLGITTCHYLGEPEKITDFINQSYKNYFDEEQLIFDKITDNRIHCCIYMIPNDFIDKSEINLIENISKICNLIPVISKADIYTESELKFHREKLTNLIDTRFFYCSFLAVSASEDIFDADGLQVRGRQYPWGFIAVEKYLDFSRLQAMLICENFHDLKERTNDQFYLEFRSNQVKSGSNKEEVFRKLYHQMEEVMEKKYELKKNKLIQEEIDIEKMLSATKLSVPEQN